MPKFVPAKVTKSIMMRKSSGDWIQPCLTPAMMSKSSVAPLLVLSKAFFEIDVVDYEGCLEFLALLHDVVECKDLFGAGSSLPEASLFPSQDAIHL